MIGRQSAGNAYTVVAPAGTEHIRSQRGARKEDLEDALLLWLMTQQVDLETSRTSGAGPHGHCHGHIHGAMAGAMT